MKNEAIEKIKNARLSRKAKQDSGLLEEIRKTQKDIVVQSFSKTFNIEKHRVMMKRLKTLKLEYSKVGK